MAVLNESGLQYFWSIIKGLLDGKVSSVPGKQLSQNDYTTEEKDKLASLNNYVHPTTPGNKHVPAGGKTGQILKWYTDGMAQWEDDVVYTDATQTKAGLMTAADKKKLDGVSEGANKYIHPTYTAKTNGLYKVTVDESGHVSAVNQVSKADITALGIPSTNTTYSAVTASDNGLMTASDKKKLDEFGSAGSYALKNDITTVYQYKGSVDAYKDLPTSGQKVGDVYDVADGMNYAWNGSKWDGLGQVFTITRISNAEIDAVLAS